jgi:hypothetical protein
MITKEDLAQRRTFIEKSIEACGGDKRAQAGQKYALDLVNEIERLRRIALSHERMIRDLLDMISEAGEKDAELAGIAQVIKKVADLYFQVHPVG